MTDPEKQAEELEERSKRLGEQIAETHKDWEAKRNDAGVPGAPPREPGDGARRRARAVARRVTASGAEAVGGRRPRRAR